MHLHRPIHRPIVRSIVDVVLGVPRPGPRRAVVMSTCAGVGAFTLLGLWALHVERRPASARALATRIPVDISLEDTDDPRPPSPVLPARPEPLPAPRPPMVRHTARRSDARAASVQSAQAAAVVVRGPERARQSDRRNPGGGRCQRLRRRRDPSAGHEHGPWRRKSNAGKPVASVGRRRQRRRAGPLRAGRPRESELVMSLAERGGFAADRRGDGGHSRCRPARR